MSSIITFFVLNEHASIGQWSDVLWRLMNEGKYKSQSGSVHHKFLPIRRPGEGLVLGYLLVSIAVASLNNVMDLMDEELPDDDVLCKRDSILLPVDYEPSESVMNVDIMRI